MYGSKHVSLKSQRGISLTGLIVALGLILFVAMLGMKIFPFFMEYSSAKEAIASIKASRGTPIEMKRAFNKMADVNSMTSISSNDLIITKINGETELAFDYDAVIPLFKNVHLGIKFAATTDPTGTIPEKSTVPERP
jgi:hypothetical protein